MRKNTTKKAIDYNQIERIAHFGCTDYEIAYALGYTPEHFCVLKKKDKLIRQAIDKGSNDIKVAIRRGQLKIALPDKDYPGNTTMLIWLGKQILHQSDHLKLSGDKDSPVEVNLSHDDLDAELKRLINIASRAISPSPGPESKN